MKVCKYCGKQEENGVCPDHGDSIVEEWEYWTAKVTKAANELTKLGNDLNFKSRLGDSDKILLSSQVYKARDVLEEAVRAEINRYRGGQKRL